MHAEAIAVGKTEIQHDEIEGGALEPRLGLALVDGAHHLGAERAEPLADQERVGVVVFDE